MREKQKTDGVRIHLSISPGIHGYYVKSSVAPENCAVRECMEVITSSSLEIFLHR
jgi:hypothetical protein